MHQTPFAPFASSKKPSTALTTFTCCQQQSPQSLFFLGLELQEHIYSGTQQVSLLPTNKLLCDVSKEPPTSSDYLRLLRNLSIFLLTWQALCKICCLQCLCNPDRFLKSISLRVLCRSHTMGYLCFIPFFNDAQSLVNCLGIAKIAKLVINSQSYHFALECLHIATFLAPQVFQ